MHLQLEFPLDGGTSVAVSEQVPVDSYDELGFDCERGASPARPLNRAGAGGRVEVGPAGGSRPAVILAPTPCR